MPAARRQVPPPAPEQPEPAEPPFYEAAEDLFIAAPGAGVMRVAARRAGDRVSPAAVERNGWGGKVRVPARFAGQLAPPPPAGTGPPADPADITTAAGTAGEE